MASSKGEPEPATEAKAPAGAVAEAAAGTDVTDMRGRMGSKADV
jgi:hypothetical protein